MKWLERLNDEQREAVEWNDSPLLVLAGAGSGKTRVITTKIAYLIEELDAPPWSILAMTFTNKAAQEMRERVGKLVGEESASQVTLRTFHSLGAWLLRVHAEKLNLSTDFTIYDDEESLTLLASCFPNYRKSELKRYQRGISRCKDSYLSPDDDLTMIDEDPLLSDMYREYQRRLESIGNVDFGDLISRAVFLLRNFPEVKSWFHKRFSILLVDEYQDTNTAQYLLLKEMWAEGNLLTAVGDDDQSIYRFRGAKVENILSFSNDFPNTKIVKLEQNYRSTGNILAAASAVISNNHGRMDKTMWSDSEDGPKPVIKHVRNHYEEAEYCASLVRKHPWGTAILYRTNAQSVAFETLFTRLNINYTIVGSFRFFDREEIKDGMAALKIVLNPKDEVSFVRVLSRFVKGVGSRTIEQIVHTAEQDFDSDIVAAIREIFAPKKNALQDMLAWYDKGVKDLEEQLLPDMIHELIYQSGIQEFHRKQDEQQKTHKEETLQEFVNISASFPKGRSGLVEMLESLDLDPQQVPNQKEVAPDPNNLVTLITIHNTKGLEFDNVIVSGMEDELFPGVQQQGFSTRDVDIEEERRLFYVAMTRAKKALYFTTAHERLIWGSPRPHHPSRFLQELPKDIIEVENLEESSRGGFVKRVVPKSSGKPSFGKVIPNPVVSTIDNEDFIYSLGDRVYHMSYGSGYVIEVKMHQEQEIVKVRFDSGKVTILIAEYAGLEKIFDSI